MREEKIKGCLIGGASGDALGYSVEFLTLEKIIEKYGEKGIREYDLQDGKALISDDTQMTLFTAMGIIESSDPYNAEATCDSIYKSYRTWFSLQYKEEQDSLFPYRSPGLTCLLALSSGKRGSVKNPIHFSQGSGGVMRVSPIGLFYSDDIEKALTMGAEAASMTHDSSLGYIPAAALCVLISLLLNGNNLFDSVIEMENMIDDYYFDDYNIKSFINLIDIAIELATETIMEDSDAISEIGKGWTADEALAIAIYSALRYPKDFESAIIASVNHSGDSDTTGSLTGNIILRPIQK